MSKTVTISDALATVLEERRKQAGYASLDAAAEAYISRGLVANDDQLAGHSEDQLRTLIDEAEASGPEGVWDAAAAKKEVLRRYNRRG